MSQACGLSFELTGWNRFHHPHKLELVNIMRYQQAEASKLLTYGSGCHSGRGGAWLLALTHTDLVYVYRPALALRTILTIWKVGKDGVEAGTSFVPDAVPRPLARISVTAVAASLVLFVLKSFISTAVFALAVMGLCYFTFIALNKDEAPKGGGGETTSVDDSLEEARKIMDKYK
ncbi:hypothetical protein SASPL_111227 [Salvia splendens]|uniref:Uncharacterized protein n=1 Tax=Salvia splendens TaxID=180675 RepID=A0A8X9A3F5_SALSN|nr:hypothetical protein SASPL_111227 [Salvia splendens]